jgi:hypothetical protein
MGVEPASGIGPPDRPETEGHWTITNDGTGFDWVDSERLESRR